jgi:hypothetical protein
MKFQLVLVGALIALLGCGSDRDAQKTEENPRGMATGRLGGAPWTFSSGVAIPTATGYDVTVAGMGEQIRCDNLALAQAHLSFRVPAQIGRYEFDLANPGSGSSPVFLVFPQEGADLVISSKSVVELRSQAQGRLSGAVFAQSSGSGSRGGTVEGSFSAEICGGQQPGHSGSLAEELGRIEGVWVGQGKLRRESWPTEVRDLQFLLRLQHNGSQATAQFHLSDGSRLDTYWQGEVIVGETFLQSCRPSGSLRNEQREAGRYYPMSRIFSLRMLESDCTPSRNAFEFRVSPDGSIQLSSSREESPGPQNRISVEAERLRRLQ